jgi:sulfate transport system substrate-binding protein
VSVNRCGGGQARHAQAGLPQYLWSDGPAAGREVLLSSAFEKLLAENAAIFPPLKLVSVDSAFGGWKPPNGPISMMGDYFDQIYQAK